MKGGKDMRTALNKVRGLGSAKDGTDTFWRQRVTAVANVPLLAFFIGFVVVMNGSSQAELKAAIANPFVAVALILVLLSALIHMRIGMKEIIDDYIHGELLKIALVMLNTFFALAIGAATVIAILKIAFGG